MIGLYVHSIYCPKCEIFKYGILYRNKTKIGDEIYTGYRIVKDVCDVVGIPIVDVDVGNNYETDGILVLKGDRIGEVRLGWNIQRYWLRSLIDLPSIELPGFCIISKNNKVKNRYISVEIVTEARKLENVVISHYVAARQILRAMLRVQIEEVLAAKGKNISMETVEKILNHVAPKERGRDEPDVWRWAEAFIKVRRMVVK